MRFLNKSPNNHFVFLHSLNALCKNILYPTEVLYLYTESDPYPPKAAIPRHLRCAQPHKTLRFLFLSILKKNQDSPESHLPQVPAIQMHLKYSPAHHPVSLLSHSLSPAAADFPPVPYSLHCFLIQISPHTILIQLQLHSHLQRKMSPHSPLPTLKPAFLPLFSFSYNSLT